MTRFGILDDEGRIVRWVYDRPTHGHYVTQQVAKPTRRSLYELALAKVGAAPF